MPLDKEERSQRLSFLKDEYLLVQKFYEDFDARVITIKGWSATIGLAALGGGFYYSKYLWLFGAGVGAIFWVLEAIWKVFQYCYAERIQVLEGAFRTGDIDRIPPFQVYTAWDEAFQKQSYLASLREVMLLPLVFFPHIVSVIVGPAIFLLNLHYHFMCK